MMHRKSGLSLLEISIALLIIAALVVSLSIGLSMAKNAKMHRFAQDIQQMQQAIETFRLRYNAWPGDMPEEQAKSHFYDACALIPQCGGDGNNEIYYPSEGALAWYHLQAADLLNQSVTGQFAMGSEGIIGENMPESYLPTIGYSLVYSPSERKHLLIMGGERLGGSGIPLDPIIPCDTAQYIDQQLDDGLPITGKLRIFLLSPNGCINQNNYVPDSSDMVALAVLFNQ